jgi:glycosidase
LEHCVESDDMPTSFATATLAGPVPRRVREDVTFPRRQRFHPSPADWRDEVLYFLLVDRFSDGLEASRPLLDRRDREAARPPAQDGQPWRWDRWAQSGAHRWQGGTLQGLRSKLDYLKDLGVTAIWLSPVFKQRGHLDTFHGYGIQHFLDVDPRFGTRNDLVELMDAAHGKGLRVILDIIFNHSGSNWVYPGGVAEPPYRALPDRYSFGAWLDGRGERSDGIAGVEDGVWPVELQDVECYTRAGVGNLGAGSLDDASAEHKRSDFLSLRDFALGAPGVLSRLVSCYKYWIALTDCDGFRIDTLKHVSLEEGRNFCGAIKEYAANLGKAGFFLVGEVAGGDFAADRYLDVLGRNLDAALDIGEMRLTLNNVAKGLTHPLAYFSGFDEGNAEMGSHRNLGQRHVSVLDDHDHVFGVKIRFSAEAASDEQIVAGVALQLFTLGVPCIYYGSEQSFAGPEVFERRFLPGWKGGDHADRYLREAMFGPAHPPQRARRIGGWQRTRPRFAWLRPLAPPAHTSTGFRLSAHRRAHAVRARFGPACRASICAADRAVQRPVLRARTGRDRRVVADPGRRGGAVRGQRARQPAPRRRRADRCAAQRLRIRAHGGREQHAGRRRIERRDRASGGSRAAGAPLADGTAFVQVRDVAPSGVLVAVNRP